MRDLANVEMFGGKNDPFVELRMGAYTFKTEVDPKITHHAHTHAHTRLYLTRLFDSKIF